MGMPEERFHDLRHSYAVVSLESGDDVKTVQGNLGHATASFTLDVYGHVSQRMRQQSAERMELFFHTIS
jgi:integrase